jgi:hypothetical protein
MGRVTHQFIQRLAIWFLIAGIADRAEAALVPGDIAIIGVNCDNPDEFAWTPLVDLSAGQQVFFSDAGWINGQFSGMSGATGDGAIRFTASAGGVAAGQILTVPLSSLPAGYVSVNDGIVGPSMSLSPSGDQLVAFTGATAEPTFLFGLNVRSAEWGTLASPSVNLDSDIYAGLTDGVNAVSVGVGPDPGDEFDNALYVGPTSGTRAELLAAISDDANWDGVFAAGNDRFADLGNGAISFSVQGAAVPEPSGLALSSGLILGAAVFGWLRRQRTLKRRS